MKLQSNIAIGSRLRVGRKPQYSIQRQPTKRTLRILTVLIATAVSFTVGELTLRTLRPSKQPIFRLDDRYLFKPVPNATRTVRQSRIDGGDRILVKYNSVGYRGEEIANPPSRKRIVIYGDSFIEAAASQLDNTFAKRLEKELGVEVINAGIGGYGPDQESLRMDDELKSLNPDLVIVSIYSGNDYGDLLRNKIFRLDNNGALYAAAHTFAPAIYEEWRAPSRFEFYEKTRNLLERIKPSTKYTDPDLAPKPEQYLDFCLRQLKRQYEDYGSNEIRYLMDDYFDADVDLLPKSDSAQLKMRLMEQMVIRLKEVAQAHQTPLLLLIVPSAIDSCSDYEVEVNAAQYPEYLPSRSTDFLESVATKHSIPFINLFKPFQASKERAYFHFPDDHWNDAGQKLATSIVAESIRSKGFVR